MVRLVPEDADAYEPYSTTQDALPPHRNRDIPPDKYLVPYCVRENEGDARFSCPHLGCDGLSFHTARECHAHEDRYHSGPYRCGTCERPFAAQSSLERHCVEREHEIWVCGVRGCEAEGALFPSKHDFDAHAEKSSAHGRDWLGEMLAGGEVADGDEDVLSECTAVGEMCLVQACHKYQKLFASQAEWQNHAASHGHVKAIALFASFSHLDISAEDLEAKVEAARNRRCDQIHCSRYGAVLSSSQAYFKHIETEDHKHPKAPKTPKSPKPKIAKEKMRSACEEPECAGFGRDFAPANHARHVEGGTHSKAVRLGEALRQLALLPPSTPGPAAASESAGRASAHTTVGLVTPVTSPAEGGFPVTPSGWTTPTRRIKLRRSRETEDHPVAPVAPMKSEREMWLEMRNRVLETEVQELRRVVRGWFLQ